MKGVVWFQDTEEGVRVDAYVSGLPPNNTGFYGFHMHENGSCLRPDFSDAGGHYNPGHTAHPMHAGDFPMLLGTRQGKAWLSFITQRFTVKDIIGRSVVVHELRDDYTSQPAGDSGRRIGCGVIREMSAT
ncbi:MAG: superoxide dismutase family protein [Burkholderiales bacterium]